MIHLTYNHTHIAELANQPDSLPWISNGVELDWQDILSFTDSNVLVRDDENDSHALFQFRAPKLWEGHIICPAEVRGRKAIQSARRLLGWFDLNIGEGLFAKCHRANRRVFHFMPSLGFRYVETRDGQAYFSRR